MFSLSTVRGLETVTTETETGVSSPARLDAC